jgi:putative membrane protein
MSTRQFFLLAWSWNPLVLIVCVAALLAYAKAVRFRWPAQSGWFITGVALFYLMLASPVSTLADGYLFSAHMLQHLMLLLVIPPLLLLGWPLTHQPGQGARKAAEGWRLRLHPFAAWLAGLSAMWVWHERTLCNAATTQTPVRVIQVTSLIVLGLMFWRPIVGPRVERRLPPLLGVVYLFSACVGCTVLGILITFASVGVVCPVYLHPVDRLGLLPLIRQNWGITPAVDQQVGGLMMWVPACGIYIFSIVTLLARWYRAGETSESVHEPAAACHAATPATGENF